MIIEYELNGMTQVHRGMFETTGFWLRIENMAERPQALDGTKQEGFLLCNHGAFGFLHERKEIVEEVMQAIMTVMFCGQRWFDADIGRIEKVC